MQTVRESLTLLFDDDLGVYVVDRDGAETFHHRLSKEQRGFLACHDRCIKKYIKSHHRYESIEAAKRKAFEAIVTGKFQKYIDSHIKTRK